MRRVLAVAMFMGMGLVAENTIPAGAREVEPYTYTYTDAQGTQWMYRQTPFGVTKWRSSDVPKPVVKDRANPVSVADLGDEIRFERTTPFGHNVWTKKKSELSSDEKLLLDIAAEKK